MSEQDERENLLRWMQDKSFDVGSLAEATGDAYSNVYMMVSGKRRVSDAFKWRFATTFGWAEAEEIFCLPQVAPA